MSKYDFEVDLSENTSTGIILKKIEPGSTVLEFGCATGRMTCYMKEKLNCSVYIVEYDQAAYDQAIQYAADGICDDIMTFSWLERFSDITFDAVTFADVLEHLSDPITVLRNVKKVLKEDGQIYVSLPNITHNDVLLKAFENHFDYTKIGLLDDTHIHFWGYENFVPFAEQCGLSLMSVEATYAETGHTEQYTGRELPVSQTLLNYFRERSCGEVYQFVLTLGHKTDVLHLIHRRLVTPYIKSHIYYDDGSGFNAQNVYEFRSEMTSPGQYLAHYVINEVNAIRRVRFDPLELQGCILLYLSVRQSGKELEPVYNENVVMENGRLLLSDDPMAIVEIDPTGGAVVIDADIIIAGDEFVRILQEACARKQNRIEDLQRETERLKVDFAEESDKLRKEGKDLEERIALGRRQQEQKNAQLLLGIESLNTTLNDYRKLANSKDQILIEREQLLREQTQRIEEQEQKIQEMEQRVTNYKNRLFIKICDAIYIRLWNLRNKFSRRNKG